MANMGKLAYVDAMRGIAILMVISVHTGHWIKGVSGIASWVSSYGQFGVQVFFLASAYTMCLTFIRRKGEAKPVASFLIRRYFRIAPLYYLAIAVYMGALVAQKLYNHSDLLPLYPYTFENVLANVLFVHGFVPSANNNIVPGGWSIGTEMAFYLCFPILFSIVAKAQGREAATAGVMLFAAIAFNLAMQYALDFFLGIVVLNNSFLYFNLVNQLPVFLLGIAAFFLHNREAEPGLIASFRFNIAGFVLATACAGLLLEQNVDVTFSIVPVVAGLSAFFLLNLLWRARRHSALICEIGRVSYSMYIFHFLVVWFILRRAVKIVPAGTPQDLVLLAGFVLVVACTYFIARASQWAIEARGIALGNAVLRRWHARLEAKPGRAAL